VKSADKDAVVIGEVWEDASNKISYGTVKQYLNGEELDSVMNYPFREMIIKFLTGDYDACMLKRQIMKLYENYPKEVFYSLINILGSHDTPRIKTILGCGLCETSAVRENEAVFQLEKDKEELAFKRLKLAVLFQMTMPGVPCIYYGDEAGIDGLRDPFNRKTYPWGREDKGILDWYRKVTGLRCSYDALSTGEFTHVYFDNDVYGYVRAIEGGYDVFGDEAEDGFFIILLNRNTCYSRNIKLDISMWGIKKMQGLLSGNAFNCKSGYFDITIGPVECEIIKGCYEENSVFK
jgi:4-alpha-glucanotransferase